MKTLFKDSIHFIKEIYESKNMIYELSKREVKKSFRGSILGMIWAIIEPLASVLAIWFAMVVGFRGGNLRDGMPFLVFLSIGRCAWQYFSINLNQSSNCIKQYSFIIKQASFKVSILPLINVISAFILHLLFLIVVIVIVVVHGYYPSIYWLQLIYYMFALFIFLIGASWFVSAIGAFIQDMSSIVRVLLQFGFWFSPIIWSINMLPEKYQIIAKINPMVYIISGYRNSFIHHIPFWEDKWGALIFWGMTFFVMLLGRTVFKRSAPHFGDVIN